MISSNKLKESIFYHFNGVKMINLTKLKSEYWCVEDRVIGGEVNCKYEVSLYVNYTPKYPLA